MNELRVVNSEDFNQKSKTKERKKRWFPAFLIFMVFIIIYLSVNLFISFSNSYSIYTVNRGEHEDIITAEGYIFRNQKVINAPVSGFLDCRMAEGERAPLGAVVASIYNKMPDAEISAKINKLDNEIASFNVGNIRKSSYSGESVSYEQNYASEVKSAVAYGYAKDFSGLDEIAQELMRNIRKNQLADSNAEGNKSSDNIDEILMSELKAQREKIISENGIKSTAVVAEIAGVFSSKIDGLEGSLAIENLDNITPSYIKNLNVTDKALENNVEAGTPICKIINNFEWYYAAVIPTDNVTTLSVNQNIKLRFFDITSNLISGTITYISPDENGETVVVIKSNKYVESIYTLSKTNVDIIEDTYSGLKIPSDGIRVVGNQTGVYVLRQGVAKFVTIDVIYSDGQWAIVAENSENNGSGLKLYDELILNARNLYNGKIMD